MTLLHQQGLQLLLCQRIPLIRSDRLIHYGKPRLAFVVPRRFQCASPEAAIFVPLALGPDSLAYLFGCLELPHPKLLAKLHNNKRIKGRQGWSSHLILG